MAFNFDVLGKVVTELKGDTDVAAIVSANPSGQPRVRGFKPRPPTDSYDGDAQGPGAYRAFVVVVNLGGLPMRRVPVQAPTIVARCYGRTPEEAAELGTAVHHALHYVGGRVHSGLGIYASFVDDGGEQDQDPDTQQPMVTVTIGLLATTQAVV